MSKPAATAVSRVCVSVGLSICVCLCVCVCACVRVWVRVCRGYVCEHDFLKTVCVNGTPHMAHTLLICFFSVSFVFVVL